MTAQQKKNCINARTALEDIYSNGNLKRYKVTPYEANQIAELYNSLVTTGKVVTTKEDLVKKIDQWENIVSVSCGDYSIVALNNKGKVFFCGYNEEALDGLEDWPEMQAVKTGFFRTVGIDKDGFIWISGIGKTRYNFYHGSSRASHDMRNTPQENLDFRKKWVESYQAAKENDFYKMKNLLAEIYQETIRVAQHGSYISADGKTWTVNLRNDIKFSDNSYTL